jgi:hypothetical protein
MIMKLLISLFLFVSNIIYAQNDNLAIAKIAPNAFPAYSW